MPTGKRTLTLPALLLVLLVACSPLGAGSAPVGTQPPDLSAWPAASPADVGLKGDILAEVDRQLANGDFGLVDSFLVVRHGALAYEAYYGTYDADRVHPLASISKSITSLLVGLAIDQGHIESVDEPIAGYLPQYADLFAADPAKAAITLGDLLTMRSGLEWDETSAPYTDQRNDVRRMQHSEDWVGFVLEKPLTAEPGTQFVYNTGSTVLLAAMLHSATGQHADLYAQQHLFEPLGITTYEWAKSGPPSPEVVDTGAGLSLRPRDLAKIGVLLLDEGKWRNQQILPSTWVAESTRRQMELPDHVTGYGYLWWRPALSDYPGVQQLQNLDAGELDVVAGLGLGQQFLLVFPQLDLVIVSTASKYGPDSSMLPLAGILSAVEP